MGFRLADKTANALRRGAFNEIDWVKDVLCEVQRVENPNLDYEEYTDGLYDPRVFLLLDPLLKRVSRLLGLPVSPPAAAAPTIGSQSAPFSTLSSIASTVSSENVDIVSKPSPFNEDYLLQLKRFETTAWEEAAAEFARRVTSAKTPAGPLPASVLQPTSAAFAILARMVDNKLRQRREAMSHPTQHALLSDYRAGKLGGRFAVKSTGEPSASGRAGPRSRCHSPVQEHPRNSRRSEDSSRSRSRSPTTLVDKDAGARSSNERRAAPSQRSRSRSSATAPGSRVNDTLRFAPDGSGFYYVSCKSFSVAADSRPPLRSLESPRGVLPLPPQ